MPEIDLGSVIGPQGKQGAPGPQGAQGIQGPAGPAGRGIPEGGAPWQALVKRNGDDLDVQWADVLPEIHAVTLTAYGWSLNAPYSQTAAVPGVTADEVQQVIQPAPAADSRAAWAAYGVQCVEQGAGTLTFTAAGKPAADITVYVAVQPAKPWKGGPV